MVALQLRATAVPQGRLPEIDELKGLGLFLIILYHAGGVLVWQNFLHGDAGVDLFVILSGVGLALSRRHEGAASFIKRRLLAIYPSYWVVMAVFLAINMTWMQLPYSGFDIAVHILGIHAWFGDAIGLGINDSFWFVTFIVSCYLIYPFLRPLMDKPDKLILTGGILCAAVAFAYFFTGQAGCFGHIGLRLPGFFLGLLIGRLLRDGSLDLPLSPALMLGLLAFFYVPYTQGIMFYAEIVAIALALAYLFAWKRYAPEGLVKPVSKGFLFLGAYSLEIFLIHQPLIRAYNYQFQAVKFNESHPSAGSLVLGMAAGLLITFFAAVELRRLLDRIRKRLSGSKSAS